MIRWGVYNTRNGSDQIGLTKPGQDRTGLPQTWIGLGPIDKTRTGSKNKSDRHKFSPK